MALLEESRNTLASQNPPDYLALDHGRLIDTFDLVLVDAKRAKGALETGDQTEYRNAYEKFLTHTQAFLEAADNIRQAVVAHRGG